MNGIQRLPNAADKLIDEQGRPSQVWWRFFNRLFDRPPRESAITVGASPFLTSFTQDGFVIVEGGTVSLIELLRGSSVLTTYNLGATAGQFVVKNGDAIQITYTVAPTVTFFPD